MYPESTGSLWQTFGKFWQHRSVYDSQVRRLTEDVRRFVTRCRPKQIWVILNSLATIDVCYRLMGTVDCQWIVQIWDDPLHLAIQRHLDRFHRKRTLSRFDQILAKATRVGVICEEMQSSYQQKTDAECVIVRHGLDASDLKPRSEPTSESEFRIGLAGSMYCDSAWQTLQKALDQLHWRLGSKQVVLVVVGGEIKFRSRSSAECRFYGWRTPEETQRLLQDCDLLYLPQAFESHHRPLTQLSFPTKLSTYVATGRPVLIHAPSYGSLARFCKEHDFGIVCQSLDAGELGQVFCRIATDSAIMRNAAAASGRIAKTVLTPKRFCHAVDYLLGLDSSVCTERSLAV